MIQLRRLRFDLEGFEELPEELPDELEPEELLLSDDIWFASATISWYFFSNNMSFGAFYKNSLRSSVRAPKPMLVK
jgi:hypothetical protein